MLLSHETAQQVREKLQLAAIALKASDTPVRINHGDLNFLDIHKYMSVTATRWTRATRYTQQGMFYSANVPGVRVRRATNAESYKPQWIMEKIAAEVS